MSVILGNFEIVVHHTKVYMVNTVGWEIRYTKLQIICKIKVRSEGCGSSRTTHALTIALFKRFPSYAHSTMSPWMYDCKYEYFFMLAAFQAT